MTNKMHPLDKRVRRFICTPPVKVTCISLNIFSTDGKKSHSQFTPIAQSFTFICTYPTSFREIATQELDFVIHSLDKYGCPSFRSRGDMTFRNCEHMER